MRGRFPVAATLLTLVMLPILLALSYWQFAIRRPWKADLIARLEAARTLPPLTAADLAQPGAADFQYRRATVDCRPGRVRPYDIRGGTSAGTETDDGDGGFLVLVDCAPAGPRPPAFVAVAGWTLRPDAVTTLNVDTRFTGVVIDQPYGPSPDRPRFMLIPATAVPPLAPSRLPVPADLPDNHLSYAFQWLAFAVTLAAVYGVYLRQWRRGGRPETGIDPFRGRNYSR